MLGLWKINHIKYGLIMSKITALCLVLMELTGQNQSFDQKSPLVFLFMVIAPLVVWWFGMTAKKKALKNKITYKQAFVEGLKISFVYALISPLVFLLYYLLVNPDILSSIRLAYGLTAASYTLVIVVDLVAQVISAIVFGSIYAAVLAFFVKSKS